jgi:hypothetical protein
MQSRFWQTCLLQHSQTKHKESCLVLEWTTACNLGEEGCLSWDEEALTVPSWTPSSYSSKMTVTVSQS